MFRRLLVANRGEIACRIIATARRLGVASVAVYSEADAGARHVRLADEAQPVGPAPARESYLRVERVLEAARRSGADAVHPGYGFLAENADFAQACIDAGLVFVGPPPQAIRLMGSKSAARALAERSGLPVTPGYHGDAQDDASLRQEALRVGFPLMVKAVAGGGGRGMRRVERAEELAPALAACRREAAAAFGDERLLMERYLERARHVEVQVFADAHGNVVHLFERDCSVQRRHQKILEEAPAPGVDEDLRTRLCAAAVTLARAAGYLGAGTVEFLLAADGGFHFMEMNTRLQVEHPVTELITGLDLVEWQLRVAAGEPLPLAQRDIRARGHAIEARLCAEDPAHDYRPATGRIEHLALPEAATGVRVDTGVEQGDTVGPHYDSLMAKLVVHDEDRERARLRLLGALAATRVVGVETNRPLLSRLLACRSFAQADLDTGLMAREREQLLAPTDPPPTEAWVLAALAQLAAACEARAASATASPSPWRAGDGWRLNAPSRLRLAFRHGERQVGVLVRDGRHFEMDGAGITAHAKPQPDGSLVADLDGRRLHAFVVGTATHAHVFVHGHHWALATLDPLHRADAEAGRPADLAAPMPGTVTALLAAPGERVRAGQPLLVLEAMKMEHSLLAPADGVVTGFRCAAGEQVAEGTELVQFEPD